MGAQFCQELIWPKKFVREFLGGLGNLEKLGLDIGSAANIKFWSHNLSGISRDLVSMLGFSNVQLKLLVQLIKIGDKYLCARM